MQWRSGDDLPLQRKLPDQLQFGNNRQAKREQSSFEPTIGKFERSRARMTIAADY